MKNRSLIDGFTLVEVLVVIAVISLLSSIVFVNIEEGRAQARNAKKIQEVQQVKNAIELSRLESPNNFPGEPGEVYQEGSSDTDKNGDGYEEIMQEFVDEGHLSAVPQSSDGESYLYSKDSGEPVFLALLEEVSGGSGSFTSTRSGDSGIVRIIYSINHNDYWAYTETGNPVKFFEVRQYTSPTDYIRYSYKCIIDGWQICGEPGEFVYIIKDINENGRVCTHFDVAAGVGTVTACPEIDDQLKDAILITKTSQCDSSPCDL